MFKSTVIAFNEFPKSCKEYLNNRFRNYGSFKEVQIIFREDNFDYVLALKDEKCLLQEELIDSFNCIKNLEKEIELKGRREMTIYLKRKLKI